MGEMAEYYAEQQQSGRHSSGSYRSNADRRPQAEEKGELPVSYGEVTVIRAVEVEFLNNSYKTYHFWTDLDLLPGDIVVCEVSNTPPLALARVVIMLDSSDKANKWIIDVVDTARHDARMAREKAVKELKAQMAKRRKTLEDEVVYKALAATDDTMADLLARYEAVNSGTYVPQAPTRKNLPPRRKPQPQGSLDARYVFDPDTSLTPEDDED